MDKDNEIVGEDEAKDDGKGFFSSFFCSFFVLNHNKSYVVMQ